MADNVIDELQLKFSANASGTNRSLGTLANKLREIKESVAGIESSSRGLDQFSASLRNLSNIDLKNLSTQVNTLKKLSNIKFDNLSKPIDISVKADSITSATRQIEDFKGVMSGLSKNNIKDTGITSFVNSVRRLSEVDLSKFDTNTFNSVAEGVKSIAAIPDISDRVIRLVDALAKLSKAGDQIKTVSSALPELGRAIQKVAVGLASSGGIPGEIIAFVSALGQLANAGNKTSTTAMQLESLSTSLKQFFASMQNAPIVSENALRMTEALGQLANAGSKTGAAAKSVTDSMNRIGSARLDGIKGAIKDLGNILEKVAGKAKSAALKIFNSLMKIGRARPSLMSTTNTIRNMIAALIGFRGITGFASLLKETIELGANLTEIDHIVESVFGDMSGAVDSWAKSAITEFGIAEHSAKQYAGVLSSMFQASQIGYKDAGKMAMDLVGLAGDLSAFYNIDTETAYNKIRSGMAGMVRPLRDLGIDLTAATLQEYALSQGITKSYSAMTQAEKVMLRYQYLMSVTTTQQGDFQRTNLSLANSLRTLKAYIQAVGTQIGAGLGSAIRHVVVWLNKLMAMLLKAATAFATFMQTIFGKYKGGASGIAIEGLGDSVDYADELGDAADSVASGLGNAADAAKELKKDLSVLPFDELNQLNKDEQAAVSASGSPNVGTGGVGGIGDIMDGLLDIGDMDDSPLGKLPEWFSKWAKAMKDAVKVGDFQKLGKIIADGLNVGIDKLYEALDPEKAKAKIFPYIDAFTTTFNNVVKYLHWEELGRSIGEAINIVVGSLNRILEGIEWVSLGKQLASAAYGLIDEINFYDVGRLIGNKIMVIWDILYGFVTDFPWATLGIKIGNLVNGLFSRINFTTVALTIAGGLNGLFTTLKYAASRIKWGEIAQNVVNGINTFISTFEWKRNGKILNDFLQKLADTLVQIAEDTNWEELGEGIADFLAAIEWIELLKKVGDAIITALSGIIKGMLKEPEGAFALAVIAGITLLKFSHSSFGSFAGNLVKAITGKTVMQCITDGFKSLFSGSIKDAAGSKEVASAGETAAKTIAKSVTGGGGAAAGGASMGQLAMGAGVAGLIFGGVQIAATKNNARNEQKRNEWVQSQLSGVDVDSMYDPKAIQQQIQAEEELYQSFKDQLAILPTYIDENQGVSSVMYVNDEQARRLVMAMTAEEQVLADLKARYAEVSGSSNTMGSNISNTANLIKSGSNSIITSSNNIATTATSNLLGISNRLRETKATYNETGQASKDYNTTTYEAISGAASTMFGFNKNAKSNLGEVKTELATTGRDTNKFSSLTSAAMSIAGGASTVMSKAFGASASGVVASMFGMNKSSSSSLSKLDKKTQGTGKETEKLKTTTDKAMLGMTTAFGSGFAKSATHISSFAKKVGAFQGDFNRSMADTGAKSGAAFSSSLGENLNVASMSVSRFAADVERTMSSLNLYSAGREVGESFASGIESVHIRVPYIYVSGWNTVSYGDGYSMFPNFGVAWYRKGGLFKGGNGQIVGIGEDNRDEAVLPLEDRRAMSKIGSAIADAGGSGGISDDVVDRLADRIADIIINTRAEEQTPMVYSELKVNDEVLARAVTKGQRKLDYRNNPTPQMA